MFRTRIRESFDKTRVPQFFACAFLPVIALCLLSLVDRNTLVDKMNAQAPLVEERAAPVDDTVFPGSPLITLSESTPAPSVDSLVSTLPTDVPATADVAEAPPEVEATPVSPVSTSPPDAYAPITRLVIPSVGINSSVEVRSLDPGGIMQTPGGPDVVSWYDFSSQPAGSGNAVFAGHLDYAGYGPAVFWRLGDVQAGEEIEVHHADGTVIRYRVTSVQPFAATDNASSVVASAGRPTITLITCDGEFNQADRTYDTRLVVTGDRID